MDNLNQTTPFSQQSQQVNATPPPMPEPSQIHSLFKWVLIIAIVAFLSSSTTYFVLQSQRQTSLPAEVSTKADLTPTPDETVYTEDTRSANWKTYTNTKFGYSVKYPNEWNARDFGEQRQGNPDGPFDVFFIDSIFSFDSYPMGSIDVSVFVYDKSNLSAQFELRQSDKSKLTKITFAGQEATKSEETGNIYILYKDYFYSINGETRFNPKPENVKIIDQILSTFRFTQ